MTQLTSCLQTFSFFNKLPFVVHGCMHAGGRVSNHQLPKVLPVPCAVGAQGGLGGWVGEPWARQSPTAPCPHWPPRCACCMAHLHFEPTPLSNHTHKQGDTPVRVLRDGVERLVSTYELLVGDLVLVETGDIVPADGLMVAGDELRWMELVCAWVDEVSACRCE